MDHVESHRHPSAIQDHHTVFFDGTEGSGDGANNYKTERNKELWHDQMLNKLAEQLRVAQADSERLRQQVSTLNSQKQDLANALQQVLMIHLKPGLDESMVYGATKLPSTGSPPNVEELLKKDNGALTPAPSTTYASIASSPPSPESSAVIQNPARLVPAQAAHSPSFTLPMPIECNLQQLQSLMAAAHKLGNEQAFARIKAFCAEAHATPRDQKTDLQRYLLTNWRNPLKVRAGSIAAGAGSRKATRKRIFTYT